MDRDAERDARGPLKALSWMPLLVGAINSYGPVAFNYGFALYFLDYRHGFVKRGLVGEMFSRFAWMPRGVLLGIEYGFLALAFALTYVVFRGMLFDAEGERRLAAVLLSAPAMLPHLGYLFAQPDVTLYILLLCSFASLAWMRPLAGAALSCALCCVALLVHEAFSLMFYPLVVAILLHLCTRRRLPWIAGIAHLVIVAVVFAVVLYFGELKVSPDVILHEAQARTNVGIQRQVYDVMASNFAQQHALVQQMYTVYVWRVLAWSLAISAAYFVLLGRLLFGAMRAAGCSRQQRVMTGLLMLAPLLLCGLGHDVSRWLGATGIDATLFVLWLYISEKRDAADPEQKGPVQSLLIRWALGPNYAAWLIYLIVIGPLGATGIRSAEQIVGALWGG